MLITRQVFNTYRSRIADFNAVLRNLPPDDQQRLAQSYSF